MFGTRRTNLKANNGKVQCKSGGGWITIDEFLTAQTPIEVEKLEWRDPMIKVNAKLNPMSVEDTLNVT